VGPLSGHDVLTRVLRLSLRCVATDGSCWLSAVLATVGLCEHAWAPGSRHRSRFGPTERDQARDVLLRGVTHAFLRRRGRDFRVNCQPDEILRAPAYRVAWDEEPAAQHMGEWGDLAELAALAEHLRLSVVAWDRSTLSRAAGEDGGELRQQVAAFADGAVSEQYLTHAEIVALAARVPCVHVQWEGRHFSAWVSGAPPQLDPDVARAIRDAVLPAETSS
jgi:hypothetical protein